MFNERVNPDSSNYGTEWVSGFPKITGWETEDWTQVVLFWQAGCFTPMHTVLMRCKDMRF